MAVFSTIPGYIERLSFRSKMGLATIAACAATVAIACIAFTVHELATYRIGFDQEQQSLSEVLAANTSAAVLFNDDISAKEVLSATRLTPQVDAAYVQTPDGEIFSFYAKPGIPVGLSSVQRDFINSHQGPAFTSEIVVEEDVIGELVLLTNLDELQRTISSYALIAAIVFVGSILFAIVLARWEAAAMYSPMLHLRNTIQSIRETRDYSARVKTSPDKDFGRLIDNFNAMLEEIESRDERLEKLVGDLMKARDDAQSSNTAKSQFLANMSHELRTPLNAIINYSEMVAEDLEDGDVEESKELVSDVKKIQSAGLHLLNLINGILDLSKIEAGKMDVEIHQFDIKTMIREASDTVRPAADRNGNQLVIEVKENVKDAITDSMKLNQCILNLLSNACKFTSNGVVRNTVDVVQLDGVDWIKIQIQDTGIGMDQSQVSKLFEAFVQADASTTRQYGGTGLGLAITKRLVELMGGRMDVDSQEGLGSTFTIHVPRVHPSHISDDEAKTDKTIQLIAEPEKSAASDVRKALIVDDDPAALELMQRIADRLGYETVTASDGKTALQYAGEHRPSVILLDLHMPVMDGWTLLEQLRADETLASIPTIVISVDDDQRECYRLGAEDYFTKPVNRIELERALLSYTKLAGGKILVVEDNDDAADLVKRAGTNVGYTVTVTGSAEEGLACLEQDSAIVGVILDLGLPGMDGFEFLQRLRGNVLWQDIPVIVFSAQELTNDHLAQLREDAQGYHVKGAASPRSVVSDLMNQSAAASPQEREKREAG